MYYVVVQRHRVGPQKISKKWYFFVIMSMYMSMPARNIFSLSGELLILFPAFAADYIDIAVKADGMFHFCGNNWIMPL
jgi:hypothetical protein